MKKHLTSYPEIVITIIMIFVCVIYFIKLDISDKGITLGLPHKDEDPKHKKEYIAQRNFTTIILTGDEVRDKSKLKIARLKLREIYNSQSTKEGVHFIFSNKSKYWAFIEVLDIFETEKTEIFGIYGSEIWAGNDNIPEKKFN